MSESRYNPEELLIVLLSRQVRDGEVCACGANSMLPAAALLLARELHAPDTEIMILGSRTFFPFRTSRQFHFMAQRGELDLFFLGGLQIDRLGNYNLHQLGTDPERPQRRFPGGFGGGLLYYATKRVILFRTEHSPRTMVERVDFISAAAQTPPDVLRHGGLDKVVTPLAIMSPSAEDGSLRLESANPPHTPQVVQERTGFDLHLRGDESLTPEPTDAELAALRGPVRTTMMQTGTYPEWAEHNLPAA